MKVIENILSKCHYKPIYTLLNKSGVYCCYCHKKVDRTINKEFYIMNKENIDNKDCKHYVKNWNKERGTYLCSNCNKDLTSELKPNNETN